FYFECYPHPALIGLFNLTRVLPYKVNCGEPAGWAELLRLLRSMRDAELPIQNVHDHVLEGLPQTKPNEDLLDALVAAYVGAYFWWFGTARSIVLGSLTDGYIVTPCNDRMRPLLLRAFGESNVNPVGVARAERPSGANPSLAPAASVSGPGATDRQVTAPS